MRERSILLLARGTARQHEFAVRTAIGASRPRIIRQLLTESLLLSLTGAMLGVLLAYRALAIIVDMLPQHSFPHEAAIQACAGADVQCGSCIANRNSLRTVAGPAAFASRGEPGNAVETRKIAGSVRGRAAHNALIAGQIALTLLMLSGAGAAMGGFLRLMRTPLGYDPHNVMSVGIPVHDGTYPTWAARSAYFDQLLKKVATVPGVNMAAISSNATPPSNGWQTSVEILGKPAQADQKARINFVSPGYFPVLHIPVAEGRIWDAAGTTTPRTWP